MAGLKFTLKDTGAFQSKFEFGSLSISGNSKIGFRPYQLLVSSIAGCSGGVFKKVLDKKRISYQNIEITADVERNEQKENKVTKIHLHFLVKGENLKLEQLEKSLKVAMKNCPMAQSVKGAIAINETVEAREPD
ncbi:OsmC family protein [Heyndrickxia acidiproducens]|uniref:OsmC family protein n=1 Tax=Heyndrickxia acidiproducens TaxID=1121084 RepID=UPI0003677F62